MRSFRPRGVVVRPSSRGSRRCRTWTRTTSCCATQLLDRAEQVPEMDLARRLDPAERALLGRHRSRPGRSCFTHLPIRSHSTWTRSPFPFAPEGRVRERVRDERDRDPRALYDRDGQRHAVERDRSLVEHEVGEPRGQLDREPRLVRRAVLRHDRRRRPRRGPVTKWPPRGSPDLEAPLDVHQRARRASVPSVVRRSVSPTTSNAATDPSRPVTVRQQPSIAIESPGRTPGREVLEVDAEAPARLPPPAPGRRVSGPPRCR